MPDAATGHQLCRAGQDDGRASRLPRPDGPQAEGSPTPSSRRQDRRGHNARTRASAGAWHTHQPGHREERDPQSDERVERNSHCSRSSGTQFTMPDAARDARKALTWAYRRRRAVRPKRHCEYRSTRCQEGGADCGSRSSRCRGGRRARAGEARTRPSPGESPTPTTRRPDAGRGAPTPNSSPFVP
jgi:hypothetical protein